MPKKNPETSPNKPLPRQYVDNMNWATHALVNVMTREQYAARFGPAQPSPVEEEECATTDAVHWTGHIDVEKAAFFPRIGEAK